MSVPRERRERNDHRGRPAQELSHRHGALAGDEHAGGSRRIDASWSGYRELLRWAKQFEQRRWAVEGARGWGRHLAQWLVARGETVLDVPSTATARVRELSRGGRRKTDVIDAAAAACVAALQGDASPVAGEDHTTGFALVEERRGNLAAQRVRVANQLHAVLRDLVPGGAELQITARSASTMLRSIRPASQCERTRKELAHDLVRDLRAVVGQSRMEPDFAGRRVRSRSYFLRAEAQRGGGDELGRVGWSLAVSS